MQAEFIYELSEQNFRQTIESSQQTPVLVHLWAPQIPESSALVEPLKQLANQYQGAFQLALLNCEIEQTIASQFGVQSLPTVVLLSQGQALDGLAGPQLSDPNQAMTDIAQMLAKHLPSQEEMQLKQAQAHIQAQEFTQALAIISALPEQYLQVPEVQLLHAQCLVETAQFEQAKTMLEALPTQYKDSDYQSLMAKIELHEQAANSPEIQNLEDKVQGNPTDFEAICELATAYHQANRDDDALALLMAVLLKDMNAGDGKVKAEMMTILSALGQNHPVAKQYRRKLYAMLY